MKIKEWSKSFLWIVLGAVMIGSLSFIYVSHAQTQFVKLVMRMGEERVLEDGTKVGISKGEGDLVIVTLSRSTAAPSSGSLASPGNLKLGTYTAAATEFLATDVGSTTRPMRIVIRIDGIDSDGTVHGGFTHLLGKARMTGKMDHSDKLQLKGYVISGYTEWQVTLTATIGDKALTKGTYRMIAGTTTMKGEFNIAELAEDN